MTPTTLPAHMAVAVAQGRARRRAAVLDAYTLLVAYANPHRAGMALSSTEAHAVRTAASRLRGAS